MRGARRTCAPACWKFIEGLVAESVNCWPSVGFDVGAVNNWFSALLPAGFYYKTFKWPNWHVFEPSIRRLAGLGRASREPDPDRYEEVAISTDVLVVGAGVAGLAAAVGAAGAVREVLLLSSAPHSAARWAIGLIRASCRADRESAKLGHSHFDTHPGIWCLRSQLGVREAVV